jgi:hypothetical protein
MEPNNKIPLGACDFQNILFFGMIEKGLNNLVKIALVHKVLTIIFKTFYFRF